MLGWVGVERAMVRCLPVRQSCAAAAADWPETRSGWVRRAVDSAFGSGCGGTRWLSEIGRK